MVGKSDDKQAASGLAGDAIRYIDDNPRVATRLRDGTREQLVADKALIDGTSAAPGTTAARRAHENATSTEESARASAYNQVRRIREAVHDSDLDKDSRRTWGVGLSIQEGVNRTILEAGQAILAAAEAHPAQVSHLKLKDVDLARLRAALTALAGADSQQGSAKGASATATAREDAAVKRIFSNAAHVGSAGVLEYDHDDTSGPADTHPDPARAAAAAALRARAVPPTTKAASAKKSAKAKTAKADAGGGTTKTS
jgi:hypothetical protein